MMLILTELTYLSHFYISTLWIKQNMDIPEYKFLGSVKLRRKHVIKKLIQPFSANIKTLVT